MSHIVLLLHQHNINLTSTELLVALVVGVVVVLAVIRMALRLLIPAIVVFVIAVYLFGLHNTMGYVHGINTTVHQVAGTIAPKG